jgi:hypothetical protein
MAYDEGLATRIQDAIGDRPFDLTASLPPKAP